MKKIVVTSVNGVCVNELTVFCQTSDKKEFQWNRGRVNIDHLSETLGPGVSIYPDALFSPTTGAA